MTERPSWEGKVDVRRRVTVDQIRARCALLGPPARKTVVAKVHAPRSAAVLIPITEIDGEAAVVVTKRPATMLHNRGDWVFPGGRMDAGKDADTLATAIREASEELGLGADRIEVIGRLSTHGPIVTGFVIDTYVGIVPLAELVPDSMEVADWAVLPISALTAPGGYRRSAIMPEHDHGPVAEGMTWLRAPGSGTIPFFRIRDDAELWGTQGEIVYELLHWIFLEAEADA